MILIIIIIRIIIIIIMIMIKFTLRAGEPAETERPAGENFSNYSTNCKRDVQIELEIRVYDPLQF